MKERKDKNQFLQAALFYAQRMGWPVFPLAPRTKVPLKGSKGCLDATTDEKQIRLWWEMHPTANVGIRTGIKIIALDVDPAKGGEESFDALKLEHGSVRDTLRQVTGGGGFQLMYQNPQGEPITNGENVCGWKGIDVRGVNGYICAPPSIHPNGKEYFWDTGKRTILEETVAPADDWLLAALRGEPNGANGARREFHLPEKIPHGQQHKYLVSLAGKMRAAWMGYDEIVEALWEVNLKRCEKPGPRAHIEQYARSVCNYTPGPAHQPAPTVEPEKPVVLPEPLTADEILDAKIPPPEALIEDLLPRRGLALLVGTQRSGKTILAAQMAIALMRGVALLDYYSLKAQGPVIVFEKDDPNGTASFQDIFKKAGLPRGMPLRFFPRDRIPEEVALGPAFSEWIEREVEKTKAVLVVLDSYTALRPMRKGGGDIAKVESLEVGALNDLAVRLGCLILLIHHESITTRANGSLEWDARVAGSYSITAASECQMGMSRYRELATGATERLVRFRSRHMKDHQATFAYNAATGLFEHVLAGGAAPLYPTLCGIKRHGLPPTFGAKDLEEPMGISRPTAFRWLAALADAGAVVRLGQGSYKLSNDMEILKLPARE